MANFSEKKRLFSEPTNALHLACNSTLITEYSSTDSRLLCSICGSGFSAKFNLNKHVRKFHPESCIDDLEKKSHKCETCGNCFVQKSSLNRHIKQFHCVNDEKEKQSPVSEPATSDSQPSKVIIHQTICPLCDCLHASVSQLHKHIKDAHDDVLLNFQELNFENDAEFQHWKVDEESKTVSCFMKHSGSHIFSSYSLSYYYCHRSGPSQAKDDRKRRLKCSGSNKIEKTCPATMKLITSIDGKIKLIYQSTHIGHRMDIGRTLLPKTERDKLAAQLHEGIPKAIVLQRIRENYSPNTRKSFVTQKDLHNICRDYHIEQDVVLHSDDATSVDLLVQSMRLEKGNPVLIYKPVDEILTHHPCILKEEFLFGMMNEAQVKLFQLYAKNGVMIDSTHSMTQYGFLLSTLMVNDEAHEGLPVAILYSTRETEETYKAFFAAIKERANDVKASVFMSDDAPAMYNAWSSIFGEAKQLLCIWHVKRALFTNVQRKIRDQEKSKEVKKDLTELLFEINEKEFLKKLGDFVHKITSCKETEQFSQYFSAQYLNRTKLWAACYRIGCRLNVNMKLERWHRQLKYEEAGGKLIKRLDRSISLVQSAVTKKLIGRVIAVERSKLTSRMAEIRKRHDASKQLFSGQVTELEPLKHWTVQSSHTSDIYVKIYNVLFLGNCDCSIRCSDCSICIHELGCECYDYAVRYMICKHIHLVCTHFSVKENNIHPISYADEANSVDTRLVERKAVDTQLTNIRSSIGIEEEKRILADEVLSLIQKSDNMEQLKILKDAVSNVKRQWDMLDQNQERSLPVTNTGISSGKIVPQRRFLNLKKKIYEAKIRKLR